MKVSLHKMLLMVFVLVLLYINQSFFCICGKPGEVYTQQWDARNLIFR